MIFDIQITGQVGQRIIRFSISWWYLRRQTQVWLARRRRALVAAAAGLVEAIRPQPPAPELAHGWVCPWLSRTAGCWVIRPNWAWQAALDRTLKQLTALAMTKAAEQARLALEAFSRAFAAHKSNIRTGQAPQR